MTIQTPLNQQARSKDPQDLVERYVGLWNEPSADVRRTLIRDLWSDNGLHILQAPEDLREAAARLGFALPGLEARDYSALEARVTRAHQEFVGSGQFFFRARANAARLDDHVKFNWEMVSTNGGEVVAVGLEVLVLDDDDRIRLDYQFIEP
jgi:hypothetical protein